MASLVFPSLLLLSSIFVFASAIAYPHSYPAPKVSLKLYYETLCPNCSNFIVDDLSKIFKNGLIEYVDLKFVPYGNSKKHSNGTVTCQHGAEQCLLNKVEACIIDVWPNPNEHFKHIYCVEKLVRQNKSKEWKSCFKNLKSDTLVTCSNGTRGKKLEDKYGNMTGSLRPPHESLPWVTVNGLPLLREFKNFTSYVCEAYRGQPVPKACKNLTHQIIRVEEPSPTSEVYFADERRVVSPPKQSPPPPPPILIITDKKGKNCNCMESRE